MKSFHILRKDEINLNTIIGESNKFMTLYEMPDDSSSTVSKNVVDNNRRKFKHKQ